MARAIVVALIFNAAVVGTANAQSALPPQPFSDTIAAGEGVQTYPFDQQDTWIHGHFQRYPAYGGFSSFRPYNYSHVIAQSQLAAAWGAPHGMPYSQQFWNRYRGSYLDGHLHHQAPAQLVNPPEAEPALAPTPVQPIRYQPAPAVNSSARRAAQNPQTRIPQYPATRGLLR